MDLIERSIFLQLWQFSLINAENLVSHLMKMPLIEKHHVYADYRQNKYDAQVRQVVMQLKPIVRADLQQLAPDVAL